jgi:hypothetical protein
MQIVQSDKPFLYNLFLKLFKSPSGSSMLFLRKCLYEKVGGFYDTLYFWVYTSLKEHGDSVNFA